MQAVFLYRAWAHFLHAILFGMDKNLNFLPAIILVAGLGIALAVYVVRINAIVPSESDVSLLRPVSTADHLAGNPEAPVMVVTYSDIDCEYCKSFQEAMEQVITDYGPNGSVAWVYRHFPLADLHPYAASHAEASECATSLGGPAIFFRFIDALHQGAPGPNQFNPSGYPSVVKNLGLSQTDFESCLSGSMFEKRVADDYDNAIQIGAAGAPFSVILIKGHDPVPVSGSLPYLSLKKVIDAAIEKSAEPAS